MRRHLLGLAAAFLFAGGLAHAADVSVGYAQGQGGFYRPDDRSGPYSVGPDGLPRLLGAAPTGTANIATSQATAATTATLLVAARAGRGAVTIENLGTAAVYVGGSGVTTVIGSAGGKSTMTITLTLSLASGKITYSCFPV